MNNSNELRETGFCASDGNAGAKLDAVQGCEIVNQIEKACGDNFINLVKKKWFAAPDVEKLLADMKEKDAEIKSVRESMARVIRANDLQVKKIDGQHKEIQRLNSVCFSLAKLQSIDRDKYEWVTERVQRGEITEKEFNEVVGLLRGEKR